MRNLRLDICYDGSRYRGWQRLPGKDDTIQAKLENALSKILGEPIEISGSGRTDAGVHAQGQVANFRCGSQMPCGEILENLRRYLPHDIGIYSCIEVPDRFHARLNARQKTYLYRIWNSEEPCVFQRRYVAVEPRKLDVQAMRKAADLLVGEHDFAAFCANKHMKKSTVRRVYAIEIAQVGQEVQLSFTANGFLYNMVRILTGTLVEVGLGKRSADSVIALFGAQRSEAGMLMPPEGLCLQEVQY